MEAQKSVLFFRSQFRSNNSFCFFLVYERQYEKGLFSSLVVWSNFCSFSRSLVQHRIVVGPAVAVGGGRETRGWAGSRWGRAPNPTPAERPRLSGRG